MPRFLVLLLISVLCASFEAQAATLWRCENGGVPAFVQKKLPGHTCKVVRQASSPRAAPAPMAFALPEVIPLSAPPPSSAPISAAPLPATLPPLPPGLMTAKHIPDLPLALPDAPPGQLPPLPVFPKAAPKPTTSRGAIYRRVVNGVVEYSSKPVSGGVVAMRFVRQCYACSAPSSVSFQNIALNKDAYAGAIASSAKLHAIDPAWVRAVVHAESNFDPRAVSPKGAQGLMQLMPATARRFGVASPFEPAQNIAGGTEYLAWLLRRFKGDKRLAAAAYNAGEGAVDRYGGIPPFTETRAYVDRVDTLHARYKASQ